MVIRTLDEAEAVVREILADDQPRKAMLRMPQLIASCPDSEVRAFLEEAQRRMGERYGTRMIRKPVVIPAPREAPREEPREAPGAAVRATPRARRRTGALDRPASPPARPPASADPRPTEIPDPPTVDADRVVETPAAAAAPAPPAPAAPPPAPEARTPSGRRPAVPKLRPFSDKARPRPASGGPTMRTSDPAEIAAELADAADTGEHQLPRYAGRPRERTEVVTLLGESDMVPEKDTPPAEGTTKIMHRPGEAPTTGGTSVISEPPAPAAPAPKAPAPAPPAPPAEDLPRRRPTHGLAKTRAYENPSLEPLAPGEGSAPDTPPTEDEVAQTLHGDRILQDEPDADADADRPAEQLVAQAEQIGVQRVLRGDEIDGVTEELRDIVDELGAAQTLHGDRVIASGDETAELLEPPPAIADHLAAQDAGGGQRMEIDAAELEALVQARRAKTEPIAPIDLGEDDDDIEELDAAQLVEEGPAAAHSAEMFGRMMAEAEAEDDDTREIEGDPVAEMIEAQAAAPAVDPDGDPEDVFDSIETALRSGVLPLEAQRQGLSENEAGDLFQAFLEAAGGGGKSADEIGEETVVMDRGPAPRRAGGSGGRVDAITLFRVIRRIFAETHQRLPAWLVARTIMGDPANVLQLAIAALRLREQKEFMAYKETVADLFQRILSARLQFGKTADEIGRYLTRVIENHADDAELDRLAPAIDAVLMSDRRIAEAQGYAARGPEGERAALSLLESLAPGRDRE